MFADDDSENDDVSMEDDIDDDDVEEEQPAVPPVKSSAGDLNSSPSSSSSTSSHLPNPNPNRNSNPGPKISNPTTNGNNPPSAPVQISPISTISPTTDPNRRLFQRLWTDDDEIAILEGFYEFTSQRGTTHHAHQHDTGPFYEQIKSKLQLDFTKSQLVEKLRRLKKKYRNLVPRVSSIGKDFAFKSPHEKNSFEISQKIWGSSLSRGGHRDHDDEDEDLINDHGHESGKRRGTKRPAAAVEVAVVPVEVKAVSGLTTTPILALPGPASAASEGTDVVEETVRSCLGPLFREMLDFAMGGGVTGNLMNLVGNSGKLVCSGAKAGSGLDEKWRKQQILELEVYSKRLELLQEQIKLTLRKLQSGEC